MGKYMSHNRTGRRRALICCGNLILQLLPYHICVHIFEILMLVTWTSYDTCIYIYVNIQGVQTCFWRFSEILRLYHKTNAIIVYSKYFPLSATILSHLLSRYEFFAEKVFLSFDALHKSIHFFTSSKDWNRWSGRSWITDLKRGKIRKRNVWKNS